MRYYSCDSHLVEPAEVFEGLDNRFGDRAPRIIKDYNGKRGEHLVLPNGMAIGVGRFGIAGNRLDDPKTHEKIARGYSGVNPGVLNPKIRLDDQARDGICGEVMYPSLNMLTYTLSDMDVLDAVFHQHNDWVADYCAEAPERLIGIGCLPIPDVDKAIAEMTRAYNLGVKGFMIPGHVSPDRPYNHEDYDPFWAAAEEMNLPLTMHIFANTTPEAGMPAHWGTPGGTIKGYTFSFTTAVNSMIDIICGGVVERFPKLKLILSEFEIGWLAHILERLDHAAYRTPQFAVDYLTMKPSDYFRRNFWSTFEDDAIGVQSRHEIGIDRLLWGNDYPHHDSIWPNSMTTLDEALKGVPDEDRQKLCWDNTIALYNIDESQLPAEEAAA